MDIVGKKTLEVMEKADNYNLWLFNLIKPHLGKSVLEIGSGIGNFTKIISNVSNVYASDIDEYYLKHLRRHYKNIKSAYTNIETGKSDYKNKKFESIVCMNVLEHIENDLIALKNMNKFLHVGGKLILLVPAHMFAYGKLDINLGHFRRYTKSELQDKLERSSFFVEQINYTNFLGLFGWYINAKILKSEIIPGSQLSVFDKLLTPFLFVEKYINPPIGLSVFVVAQKK